MLIEMDASELQGAVGEAIKALRQVVTDSKQDGETRVEAAVAILDFATHLESGYMGGPDWEEFEDEEEE